MNSSADGSGMPPGDRGGGAIVLCSAICVVKAAIIGVTDSMVGSEGAGVEFERVNEAPGRDDRSFAGVILGVSGSIEPVFRGVRGSICEIPSCGRVYLNGSRYFCRVLDGLVQIQ